MMTVEMAPGPASMGMASGVTAMSFFSMPALVSSLVCCTRERWARSMSSAISSRNLKSRHRDAEHFENQFTRNGEPQQHSRHHAAGEPGHAHALFRRVMRRHRDERRDHRQRIHDHKQRAAGQHTIFSQAQRQQGTDEALEWSSAGK
jgi:hypothetical protein